MNEVSGRRGSRRRSRHQLSVVISAKVAARVLRLTATRPRLWRFSGGAWFSCRPAGAGHSFSDIRVSDMEKKKSRALPFLRFRQQLECAIRRTTPEPKRGHWINTGSASRERTPPPGALFFPQRNTSPFSVSINPNRR